MSVIRNLKKNYKEGRGEFNIHIPHLSICDEGVSAVVGPSGAGKSSLLRILSGLDSCWGWEWIFKGQDMALLEVQKRKIGFVFQSLELFPHMSALQNIQFAGENTNPSWKKELKFLISSLDLHSCAETKADKLSGGEQQRTALARALITAPRILFLDEPFSSLDQDNKSKARQVVFQMVRHYKIPALLVSHDEEDVSSLAHTVVYIQNGRIEKTKSLV